ncbi:hypothetical protein FBZ96_10281 [Bradyrhizobium stylosanthis]|uniref:Uncharacterized protein n=1 Tax=Bradyrhizobium stylosanthis TaxID=1803665 RepID=A0A560E2K5_9BRAD|nr:hypothetical protein FBZ96_10281 [Bradyrhizobium stylosanthis]
MGKFELAPATQTHLGRSSASHVFRLVAAQWHQGKMIVMLFFDLFVARWPPVPSIFAMVLHALRSLFRGQRGHDFGYRPARAKRYWTPQSAPRQSLDCLRFLKRNAPPPPFSGMNPDPPFAGPHQYLPRSRADRFALGASPKRLGGFPQLEGSWVEASWPKGWTNRRAVCSSLASTSRKGPERFRMSSWARLAPAQEPAHQTAYSGSSREQKGSKGPPLP